MLKPRGPHSRAQPARRLRVAQLLWVSEDRLVHSWLKSPGPPAAAAPASPSASRALPEKSAAKYPCPEQF